ncbi:uncharacterized protein V6R79_014838 [Siganus canaliculatus]
MTPGAFNRPEGGGPAADLSVTVVLQPPELIRTLYDWLKEANGSGVCAPLCGSGNILVLLLHMGGLKDSVHNKPAALEHIAHKTNIHKGKPHTVTQSREETQRCQRIRSDMTESDINSDS